MNLIERLASLEHEQWAHWTQHMLNNLTPENIERWQRQIKTPYRDLSEKEKESDRAWARKAWHICKTNNSTNILKERGFWEVAQFCNRYGCWSKDVEEVMGEEIQCEDACVDCEDYEEIKPI